MRLPHPIPYQGSKRNLADRILQFFPGTFRRLVEPFAGSAAITIATAYHTKAECFIINDINKPLISLWEAIIHNPELVSERYHDIWHGQLGKGDEYYYNIRALFNETKQCEYLLFLLARCVKAAVRYNARGEFNQSPDKRRLGRNPLLMRRSILGASQLLRGRTQCLSLDYQDLLGFVSDDDLVYLDPPYQGTGVNGGFNYAGNVVFATFVDSLYFLNSKEIPFILSYDGRTGDRTFGNPLPTELNLVRIEINAGRSSQATLLNRNEVTHEAVYLSPALLSRIDSPIFLKPQTIQTELFTG